MQNALASPKRAYGAWPQGGVRLIASSSCCTVLDARARPSYASVSTPRAIRLRFPPPTPGSCLRKADWATMASKEPNAGSGELPPPAQLSQFRYAPPNESRGKADARPQSLKRPAAGPPMKPHGRAEEVPCSTLWNCVENTMALCAAYARTAVTTEFSGAMLHSRMAVEKHPSASQPVLVEAALSTSCRISPPDRIYGLERLDDATSLPRDVISRLPDRELMRTRRRPASRSTVSGKGGEGSIVDWLLLNTAA